MQARSNSAGGGSRYAPEAAPHARRGRAHANPLVAAHATLLELAPEPWLSQMACNLVFMPPLVRPIRRPRP
ncbi:hypothetical protein VB636_00595, partial [Paracoccus sp. APAP_BH8]|uniref:hypothetical protein n=1 Tax=Paracoccus sp. APAP_BH8 TaxID=3110237 RepID=UPI002FD7DA5D